MRSLPQAMYDRARLLADVHPLQTVASIIGVKPGQISRMKARGWKAPPDGRSKRPMPTDFAIQSAHMTFADLTRHYGAGNSTVIRWFAELPNRRPSWRGLHLKGRGNRS